MVVDASVLANAVADDGDAGRTCRAALAAAGAVAAPDVADTEVLSVLRSMWLAGRIDDRRLADAVHDLADLPVTRWPARRFTARAAAHRGNLSAYDAVYVALAELLEADLVTADRRLAGAPGITCPVTVLA